MLYIKDMKSTVDSYEVLNMKEKKKEDAIEEEVKTQDEEEEESLGELISNFISTFFITFFVIIAVGLVGLKMMGFNMLTVDSGSMEPLYPIDSLIFVKEVAPAEIDINDVVTYVLNEDGILVTHRVVAIDSANRYFTTKGDANLTNDGSPVLWDNVVGRVVFKVPKVGALFRTVTAEENRKKVIGVIVSLIGLTVVWEIVGAVRDKTANGRRNTHTNSLS